MRIAPDKILTNDPVTLRYMSSPRSNFRRGTFYDAFSFKPPHTNVLSTKNEKHHNTLRAKLIRGYSGKDLPTLESDIDVNITNLLTLIRAESSRNRSVDFTNLAQYFTLDVLTHIAFSRPVGYLTQNRDVFNYIGSAINFLLVFELGTNNSTIQSVLHSRIMRPFQPRPTDKAGMGAMMGMANSAVAERYGPNPVVKQDMLGSFVRHDLTQQEAEGEAMVQVLGGSDTTATAIRMIMLYIVTSPTVHARVTKEINENDGLFNGSLITSANSRKMTYLQACIKEGIRIWPPIQALQSKLSPPGGETVHGVYIPEAIEVCHNAFTTQRRKEIYGEDAEYFRPERWLEAAAEVGSEADGLRVDLVQVDETGYVEKAPAGKDEGKSRLAKMESTLELVFGSGRFGCLGKLIALIELDKVIPVLLREFDFALVDPQQGFESICHGIFVQNGMRLRATQRRKEERTVTPQGEREEKRTHSKSDSGVELEEMGR